MRVSKFETMFQFQLSRAAIFTALCTVSYMHIYHFISIFCVISYCWRTFESQFNSEHNSNDCLLAVRRKSYSCCIPVFHVLCGEIITLAVSFQFQKWHIAMKIIFWRTSSGKFPYFTCYVCELNDMTLMQHS